VCYTCADLDLQVAQIRGLLRAKVEQEAKKSVQDYSFLRVGFALTSRHFCLGRSRTVDVYACVCVFGGGVCGVCVCVCVCVCV